MRILTNIQSSAVAGITRVMSSFSEYAQRRSNAEGLSLIGVSVDCANSKNKTVVQDSCTRVDENGVTILSAHTAHEPLSDVLKKADSLDDIHRALLPVIDTYRSLIQKERPDMVLLNGTYYLPWSLYQAAKAEGIPAVLHYHGSLTKETEHWGSERRRGLMRAMEATFDNKKLRYIFPSKFAKQTVEREVFGHTLRSPRAIVLPNPIPDAFFATNPGCNKRDLAYVGRWVHIKNTKFIERFAHFNARLGGLFKLNVITDAGRKSLAYERLQDVVKFCAPRRSDSALAGFYARMGLIFCPSHFETYGNVAQEAVAAGTPALVNKNMGVAEVFKEIGLEHLVVDFDTPKNVMARIQDYSGQVISKDKRVALHERVGSERVHDQFLDYLQT